MDASNNNSKYFRSALLHWHQTENPRTFPWKEEPNAYKIWLSEIILQQTRAEQGLPYYLKFVSAYPTVTALANAADDDVYKLWQGLGYYNRCKNLLFTARFIRDVYDGKFPSTYSEIINLKGVGAYTAAAIASFAYGLPYAVVDGNVYRVLSRYLGESTPIDSTLGKAIFAKSAQDLLDTQQPAAYNQAIMDLGASVCTPKKPLCIQCPVAKKCYALEHQVQSLLPVKEKKVVVKERSFHYFWLHYQNRIYLQKRLSGDIWENLHEPYLVEAAHEEAALSAFKTIFKGYTKGRVVALWQGQQKLSHQIIHSHFYKVTLNTLPDFMNVADFIPAEKINNYAFPKTIISFFDNKYYF